MGVRYRLWLLGSLGAMALVLSGPVAPRVWTTASAAEEPSPRTITVTGQGQVTVTPDVAVVHLGVETRGATAGEAMGRNAEITAAVIAGIRSLGIAEKDIQTTGIQLHPIRGPYPGAAPGETPPSTGDPSATPPAPEPAGAPLPFFRGYRAFNSMRVTVRDLGKAGSVIDGAVTAGATLVSGVNFRLEDDARGQQAALLAAVKSARAKAGTIAEASGVAITGIHSVAEGGFFQGPVPLPATAPRPGVAPPIEPGQLTITAVVTVVLTIG